MNINTITSYIDQNVPNQINKSKGFGKSGVKAIGGGQGNNYQVVRVSCKGPFGKFRAAIGVSHDQSISNPGLTDTSIEMAFSPGQKGCYGGYDFHSLWKLFAKEVCIRSGTGMTSNKIVFSEDYNGYQKINFSPSGKSYQKVLTAVVEVFNEFCDKNQ
jgi:hypothetical protein